MTDTAERVAVKCPSCSPGVETVHEVLSPGGQATVRCMECEHVHKTKIEREQTTETDVVVSQGGESFSATAAVPDEETLRVGEEFVLDSEEAIVTARITSLELGGDQRAEEAEGSEVETIWTRDVGNVEVDVTLHPKEGTGSENDTRSLTLQVPGDETFVVGDTTEYADEKFTVEQLLVREDAMGYPVESFEKPGDDVPAKDLKRVYARDETSDAWSAW
jgi:uncharacterized Zn finger protein